MAGFDHVASEAEAADPATAARNARYGLILFSLYFVFYAVFVGLNAFQSDTMSMNIGGVNLAVVYGMGLIAAALVLALIYCWLCHSPVVSMSTGHEADGGEGTR